MIIVNLDRDVSEKEFLELFRKYGTVMSHEFCVNKDSKIRNGKAFITYKSTKEAEFAMQELDGKVLNNRSIEIKRSLKRGSVPILSIPEPTAKPAASSNTSKKAAPAKTTTPQPAGTKSKYQPA